MANKREMLEEMAGCTEKILNAIDMTTIVSSLDLMATNLVAMSKDSESNPDFFANTITKAREITGGLQSVVNAIGDQYKYIKDELEGGDSSLVSTD